VQELYNTVQYTRLIRFLGSPFNPLLGNNAEECKMIFIKNMFCMTYISTTAASLRFLPDSLGGVEPQTVQSQWLRML